MIFIVVFGIGFFLGLSFIAAGFFQFQPFLFGLPFILLIGRRPILAAFLFGFLLGAFRMDLFESSKPSFIPFGAALEIQGIVETVDPRDDHQKITLKTETYGSILFNLDLYTNVLPGDFLHVSGILQSPSEETGISYEEYLAKSHIWALLERPQLLSLEMGSFSLDRSLFLLRQTLEDRIQRIFFEPEASFVSGLLLGFRKGIPEELSNAFQIVGLTHILAVSGYNISLVIAFILWIFRFLPFPFRLVLSTFFVVLFVLFVGASAAVVRAGIMGLLSLSALFSGRKSQAYFALFWTAFFMLLINPSLLLWDIGFQLSFAATLGLLLFVPLFSTFFSSSEKSSFFKEAFLVTLASQCLTAPLIAYHFERFSLISFLANVLVAPLIPLAMLTSALGLLFGKPIGLFALLFLQVIEKGALFLSQFPFAELEIHFSLEDLFFSYLLLGGTSLLFYKSTLVRAFGWGLQVAFPKEQSQEEGRHEK